MARPQRQTLRLLNVNTFEFQNKFDVDKIPEYAILSHRWGDSELSFQDMRQTSYESLNQAAKGDKTMSGGASKIIEMCRQARAQRVEWVWIDTCCIDKSSSAELGKAINSMFKWYQEAKLCYAHLNDAEWNPNDLEGSRASFKRSIWWKRGWTLQELIAPREMTFFDKNWTVIGDKASLAQEILAASKISAEHLVDFKSASIATRMSWASERDTTEDEDMAYCLIGIFDVNMDLRYGEGKGAFRRLQEMLIQNQPDESIFAWTSNRLQSSGLLAPWPDCFKGSGDIFLRPDKYRFRGSIEMQSQGLKFPAPIYVTAYKEYNSFYYLFNKGKTDVDLSIQCWRNTPEGPQAIVIRLSRAGGPWRRIDCGVLRTAKKVRMTSSLDFHQNAYTSDIYIPQKEVEKPR